MNTSVSRILLVSDSPNSLVALENLFQELEVDLVKATTGTAELQAILQQEFALILLDAQMLGMDILELADILGSPEQAVFTPIIIVTNSPKDEELRLKSYRLGAFDYIHTPAEDSILLSKVGVLIRLHSQKMRALDRATNSEAMLHEQTEELRCINDMSRVGTWNISEDLETLTLSKQMADLLGVVLSNAGKWPLSDFMDRVLEYDRHKVLAVLTNAHDCPEDELSFVFDYLGADDSVCSINSIVNFMNIQGKGVSCFGAEQDSLERKELERTVEYMTQYDALTKLPNRYLFQSCMDIAFATAKRVGNKVDVLMIDLDHFKDINDSLGHPVGDSLLQEVAKRLTACVRDSDTVARLGGDEFAIIAIHALNSEPVTPLVERCLEALARPFELGEHTVHTAGSIGIAAYPADGDSQEKILKSADLALHQAKADGRGTYHFYDQKMNESIRLRVKEESEIKTAIAEDQFELYYQPQVNVKTNKVVGMEALIRWNHPERGLVSPQEFIPLCEEVGLIVPLGEQVLKMAIEQMVRWQGTGIDKLKMSVNVSVKQMYHKEFLSMVDRYISVDSIATISLEITETLILDMTDKMTEVLNELKKRGLMLAIDDFGTGYSSLVHLKQIPADFLKVDRLFVKNIIEDPVDAVIFNSIVNLSHEMGMLVIAEGVETKEQLDYVTEHGCDIVQGYFFSRPLPKGEFEAWYQSMK